MATSIQDENMPPTSSIISNKDASTTTTTKKMLADITNTARSNTTKQTQKNADWCGTHIKFDDEGNETIVEKKIEEKPAAIIEEEVERKEEEEVKPEQEEEEEEEDASLWEIRDKSSKKETTIPKWCGKKFTYNDAGEEIEEAVLEESAWEDKTPTSEVVNMTDAFETLKAVSSS